MFQILNAQVADTAKYTCHAESKAGVATKVYRLEVHGKSRDNFHETNLKDPLWVSFDWICYLTRSILNFCCLLVIFTILYIVLYLKFNY